MSWNADVNNNSTRPMQFNATLIEANLETLARPDSRCRARGSSSS